MRRRPARRVLALLSVTGIVFGPLVIGLSAASAEHEDGAGDDTNGDGVEDDFDHDGVADDLDGDCIPDDFNGDGIPDADNTDNSIYYENCDPSDFEGEGGDLPESLPLQTVIAVLDPLFLRIPDTTTEGEAPDMFPNIPRLLDDQGNDIGPDWSILDNVLGDPGDRDLTQLPDNEINEFLLEFEDVNNEQFVNPENPDDVEFVATPSALAHTITQINRARGDFGQIAGSGSTLRGPCMGMAWSYDSDGQPLDVAWDWDRDAPPIGFRDGEVAPGENAFEQIFNSGNPFKVHVDGAVIYTGLAGGLEPGTGPLEHDWFINLEFLGFEGANIDSGGDPNRRGKNRNAGSVNLFEDLPEPAKISGLVRINGQMDAPETGTGQAGPDGGAIGDGVPFFCIASGFVDFQGGIPLSAPGAALVALSTVGLLFNARPAQTWGGV